MSHLQAIFVNIGTRFWRWKFRLRNSYPMDRMYSILQCRRLLKFKVAPYSFLRARWFRKSRNGASFQTPRQSRARDHAVKYRQTWRPNFYNLFIENVAWIGPGFQNICRLNIRPQLSLLDVKEKYTRQARVSTNETDFMWFFRSPRSWSRAKQDGILQHKFAVLGVVCGVDTKAKI